MIFPPEETLLPRSSPRVLQAYYTPRAAPLPVNSREIFIHDIASARALSMAWKTSGNNGIRLMMRIYAQQAAIYIKYIRNEYKNAKSENVRV